MADAYRFGAVEVRAAARQVLVDGKPVAIGARALDLLLALIERRGRLVAKAELLDTVWPGVIVEESNVQVQVSGLRRLLGPDVIATIPGRGYRFTAVVEGERQAPAALPARVQPSPPDGALLGREAEKSQLMALLDAHRVVNVTGAGGIGKTRLARECAAERVNRHADGAPWVDLASLRSADAIPAAIAHAAGVHLGDASGGASLAAALADRDMLLVLDNCEHVAARVSEVIEVCLACAPRLRVLATSQVPLRAGSEHVFRLGPLPVPSADASLAEALANAAVQLMERRARAADARFELTGGNAALAIELCRRLDGIPLAIEMAAARIPTLGLRPLVDRLAERLRLLRAGDRAAPERHQTLQATLDWSYSLLAPEERAVFRRLAAFSGPFLLATAQHVAAMGGLDEWDVLDALASLVEKSLVQVGAGDPPRYRLLETARVFALETLQREGEQVEAMARHGEAMAARALEGLRRYITAPGTPDAAAYVDDYDDLNAAFEHAAQAGNADCAASLSRMLNVIDFERNVHANVRRRKEAALRLLPKARGFARAQLITTLGLFRMIILPEVDRVANSRERVAAWRDLGETYQLYMALSRLGSDLAVERDFEGTRQAFAEAEALARPGWPPVVRWFHDFAATNAAFLCGDREGALRRARQMLALCEEAQWWTRAAEARVAVAHGLLFAGDAAGALATAARAEDELRAMGHRTNLGDALCIQAAALAGLERREAAVTKMREALALPRPVEVAVAMFDYAGWLAASFTPRAAEAARLLGFADRIYADNKDRRFGAAEDAERAASTLIERRIGASDYRHSRREGTDLGSQKALALAQWALDTEAGA
jgi:predicted ATPase/DNA-binding winged helix-turn-helix (wHTH) protein